MRFLLGSLLLLSLLMPPAAVRTAGAQSGLGPCALTLSALDLPPELTLEEGDEAGDPMLCERVFRAEWVGPSGLSMVRSLVVVTPSATQAKADFTEYRALMLENGWEESADQPLGEEGVVFLGSSPSDGTYSVQQLFRRRTVVAVVEATGPLLAGGPEMVLELAQLVDSRVALDFGPTPANPIRSGSVWPAVSVPTIVVDAYLAPSPLAGQSMHLGGLSGLASLDAEGTKFVAVTDRGPYSAVQNGRSQLLVLPLPAFTPSIVKLKLQNGQLKVAERVGLRLADGYTNPRTGTPYVTGLPNHESDPAAFEWTGRHRWGLDPYGLDPEGIAVDPRDGSYWIAEEYGPSILHVADDGTILLRLVPAGSAINAPGQNVRAALPGELVRRKPDRGFEGVAISPDGSRLFAIMQGPLADPDRATAEASRNVRLISLDLSGDEPRVDGMYVYQTEHHAWISAPEQDDVKVGDLAALSATRLLVAERDSLAGGGFKAVYSVDLETATNILGQYHFGGGTLEQTSQGDLAALGIQPVSKLPIVNLSALGWRLENFEGLAVVDERTIAVVDDNNFAFGGYDLVGRMLTNGVPTRLTLVHLPGTLR